MYIVTESLSEIGPILLTDNYFRKTISDYGSMGSFRILYYTPVEGYDNLAIIASLDRNYLPVRSWQGDFLDDLLLVTPLYS
jgi:hypothetical protein